jgi:hypothetical protein
MPLKEFFKIYYLWQMNNTQQTYKIAAQIT